MKNSANTPMNRREVLLLRKLDYPHIVKIVDAFIIEGKEERLYAVMELAKGKKFELYFNLGDLSTEIARQIDVGVYFSEKQIAEWSI